MTSQGNKIKFWYAKDDPYYRELMLELRRASCKGYSLVEISRALGQNMRHVYAMMRDEGVINKLPRKRQKAYPVPDVFGKILEKCEISFLQWCCSHSLDPEAASIALVTEEDPNNPESVAAHRALQQDFPKAYRKIMGADQEYSTSWQPKIDELKTDYTITIALNPETNAYVAYVHELPECRVEAPTRIKAFYGLQSRYVAFAGINKLQMLPSRL